MVTGQIKGKKVTRNPSISHPYDLPIGDKTDDIFIKDGQNRDKQEESG